MKVKIEGVEVLAETLDVALDGFDEMKVNNAVAASSAAFFILTELSARRESSHVFRTTRRRRRQARRRGEAAVCFFAFCFCLLAQADQRALRSLSFSNCRGADTETRLQNHVSSLKGKIDKHRMEVPLLVMKQTTAHLEALKSFEGALSQIKTLQVQKKTAFSFSLSLSLIRSCPPAEGGRGVLEMWRRTRSGRREARFTWTL
jgi:hypothetical protein